MARAEEIRLKNWTYPLLTERLDLSAESICRVEAAGAVKENTRSPYEEKFKGPEGIIVDIGRWPGAADKE